MGPTKGQSPKVVREGLRGVWGLGRVWGCGLASVCSVLEGLLEKGREGAERQRK